ncbi:MAG: T9SS type A sorting domain-containing protein [Chitinophagaceae bacterium]|nr:T9SS type A sorting domain-containing protein [Chitinophagaceae bacterium]
MKRHYLLLFLFVSMAAITVKAQCPRIAGIMVDACSSGATESRNEFIFCLNGNSDLNVDDLGLILPANANIGTGTNDFAPNAGLAPIGPCLTVLDDGGLIPANAPFIIFMSSDVAVSYDFSSWCAQYGTVYLLYKTNPSPTTATFLNETTTPGTQRSVVMSVSGTPSCTATYTYDVLVGTGVSVDGNFYRFPEPSGGFSLSPGFINHGCSSPPYELLPVTLEAFTASFRNKVVELSWSTSMELNASHFEVLKSTDGAHYETIGKVQATGNSNVITRYHFTDPDPSDGKRFYRLRTVDLDGGSDLSRIISLRGSINGITLIALYPNPVTDELIVEWNGISSMKTQVSIRDVAGRLLQTSTATTVAGFNQLKFNTRQLSAGQYFLTLDPGHGNIVQPFLKR